MVKNTVFSGREASDMCGVQTTQRGLRLGSTQAAGNGRGKVSFFGNWRDLEQSPFVRGYVARREVNIRGVAPDTPSVRFFFGYTGPKCFWGV